MFTTVLLSCGSDPSECDLSVTNSFKFDAHSIGTDEEIVSDEIASKRSGKDVSWPRQWYTTSGLAESECHRQVVLVSTHRMRTTLSGKYAPANDIYVDVYTFVKKDNVHAARCFSQWRLVYRMANSCIWEVSAHGQKVVVFGRIRCGCCPSDDCTVEGLHNAGGYFTMRFTGDRRRIA